MKKTIYLSVLTGITLLVVLWIVAVHSNMETQVPESEDSPDIAAVKRLLSLGADIWTATAKGSVAGVEMWYDEVLWSYRENPFAHLPPLPFGIPRELPDNNITEQGIRNITAISFCADALSETDVQFLGTLPNLECISIVSGNLCESLAEVIGKNLKNVTELHIREMTLTTSAWRGLAKLPNVSRLWLVRLNLPDESFEEGAEMSPVELFIAWTPISETGLKKLVRTDRLEEVSWTQMDISDDITSFFDECPKLETIRIEDSNIRGHFLAQMRNTDRLRTLNLHNTNIDDDTLASVLRFENLVELSIYGGNVTEASIPLFETLAKRLGLVVIRSAGMRFEYIFRHRDESILHDEFLRKMRQRGFEFD